MLQRRIGWLFSALAGLSLIFNMTADRSPEASFNVLEMSAVIGIFSITAMFENFWMKGLQLVTMTVCALIAFRLSENPYFGFAMVTIMGVLLYAYGGYKTFRGAKIALSLAFIYLLSFFSILGFLPISFEAAFKAFNWTAFIFVSSLILWFVMTDLERKFYDTTISDVNKLNRTLLEELKQKDGGCNDGDTRG